MTIEETKFWLFFFLLNALLFLPKYIAEFKTSSFIPFKGFFKGSLFERFGYLFVRYNYDVFRISIDLCFIFILLFFSRNYFSSDLVIPILSVFYGVIFSYQVYYIAFEKLYNVEPVFYNDINMLKTGITLITAESFVKLASILITIILINLSFYFLTKSSISMLWSFQPGLFSIGIISFLLIACLISLNRYRLYVKPRQGFQSQTLSIINNARLSIDAKKNLKKFDIDNLLKRCDYSQIELEKRPNIFLIAVESYGRIVLDNPELFSEYKAYMSEHENRLKENGFSARSILSTAPVSGGGSWVSYSSILFGFNIQNQGTFHSLFNLKELDEYESMTRFFRKRGYKNYYLNSLAGYEKIKIPWEDLSRFYGVDEWITYKDLGYNSHLYGFGPAPPDQYSINYAYELIKKKTDQPFTFFFLTQNSHNPFYTLPKMVGNWRGLNKEKVTGHQVSRFLVQPNIENYRKAIKYQMDFLFDFIVKNGSENDLFILVGDHQPTVIAEEKHGKETPLHIICKDAKFADQFLEYGFSNDLSVEGINMMRHEGIYSMFVKEMTKRYGSQSSKVPTYYPKGTAY